MSPDRKFYEVSENFTNWPGDEYTVLDRTCFRCRLNTPRGELIAYVSPNDDVMGFGEIFVPLSIPERGGKSGRKIINHPLKNDAMVNEKTFQGTRHIKEILHLFGINNEKYRRLKGFNYSTLGTITGEWFLIAKRVEVDEETKEWRKKTDKVKSAKGLITEFVNQQDGWFVVVNS